MSSAVIAGQFSLAFSSLEMNHLDAIKKLRQNKKKNMY